MARVVVSDLAGVQVVQVAHGRPDGVLMAALPRVDRPRVSTP